MLTWLKKAFGAAAGVIPDAIRDWVYQQIYAVMSYIGTIIDHVSAAWDVMWHFATALESAFTSFGHSVYNYFYKLVKVMIPNVIAWAATWITHVESWAWGWIKTLAGYIEDAKNYLLQKISDAVAWTVQNIWAPLEAELVTVRKRLTDWAYTAWWYITHPQNLADLLLGYLLVSLQRSVWLVARTMGDFFFRLFLTQLPRSLNLIEQIIADTL